MKAVLMAIFVKLPMPPNNLRQQGLALVIVIWILTLLTLMAGSFAMSMRRDSSVSLAIKNNAQALALAESGIMRAVFMLNHAEPDMRWQADGTVYEIVTDESRVRLRIFAESGKIDINASSEAQIGALLKWVLQDDWQQQQLLNALLDWRDADDDTRTQGAERRQYNQAGLSYGPNNAAFQSLEELQLVLGMNERIFSAIRPFITVYSGETEVNQRFALPEMLAILAEDLKDSNIQDVALQKRLQADNDPNINEGDSEQAFISENQTYTIIAEAIVQNEASAGLEVVVKSPENDGFTPFEIMDWKQSLQALSSFNDEMESPIITIQDEFRCDDRY